MRMFLHFAHLTTSGGSSIFGFRYSIVLSEKYIYVVVAMMLSGLAAYPIQDFRYQSARILKNQATPAYLVIQSGINAYAL